MAAMRRKRQRRRDVSLVVVVYNMAREAPRTLHSLSAAYQRHIDPDDYEVIVVDNGSNSPLDPKVIEGLPGNFRLIRIDNAAPSPAQAVNRGLAEARGEVIGVMIDGARIATPGLLHFGRHGSRLYDRAVVATLGWHLGYDLQRLAIRGGYDQSREDGLLASIAWPQDGYRLFEIATMAESSVDGWVAPLGESNALFMRRELWGELGGLEERFDAPGGGYVNLDTYRRACELPGVELVVLLGEGTFHQVHGGISTNAPIETSPGNQARWNEQYAAIRGRPFALARLESPPTYIGNLPRAALLRFVRAAIDPVQWYGPQERPLGNQFDRELWSLAPAAQPADPTIAALVDLAQKEFRAHRYESAVAVSRLVRERAPDEPEPQRLLSLVGLRPPASPGADSYLALGEAYGLLGEGNFAEANYRAALSLNGDLAQAHIGLSKLRMPGDSYLSWIERLYSLLSPRSVLEIGVFEGESLARVRPPTVAIGIDPEPRVLQPLRAETHIFPETSDAFFARRGPDALLGGHPLGIGFIDGLHLYEQALRDFINLERYCGARSLILIHDTVPLDEATQSRTRDTQFHTGDVWKVVLTLKHYRSDLDVFTIATPPTGITVVTGLDPTSHVLTDSYEEAIARFIDAPFSDIENRLDDALNIVPNDWRTVETRLKARRVL